VVLFVVYSLRATGEQEENRSFDHPALPGGLDGLRIAAMSGITEKI